MCDLISMSLFLYCLLSLSVHLNICSGSGMEETVYLGRRRSRVFRHVLFLGPFLGALVLRPNSDAFQGTQAGDKYDPEVREDPNWLIKKKEFIQKRPKQPPPKVKPEIKPPPEVVHRDYSTINKKL